MLHPNVFYIQISPYSHYYSLNFILDSLHKHLKLNKVPFYFFVNKEYHKILFEIPSHSPHYPLLQQIKEFVELSPQGK